jgi:hypothetical protein
MGQTYFTEGRVPAWSISSDSFYWRSVEYAYRQALQQTKAVQKVGEIKINRFESADNGITNADEGYAAPMAVFLMSLFRGTSSPGNTSLELPNR